MARLMALATHHKGGTVWIKRVITALSRAIGVPWIGIWSDRRMSALPETGRAFLVNWEGAFPEALWARDDVAFAHVIRDPRDVLLSGCTYHQTAGPKGEKFLHTPRADLGGATYQDHLTALPTEIARLQFEMANRHADVVQQMRAWPYDDPRTFELRYEDLMQDTDCMRFDAALAHLGLQGQELAAGRKAFWDNSLFGGLSDPDARTGRLATHIQSGGQPRRWQVQLPLSIAAEYVIRFGADLIALGYETDDDWVNKLQGAA